MNKRLEKIALTKYRAMMGGLSETAEKALTEMRPPKVKLTSGELRANPDLAKPYKVHDYDKHLKGLNKGTDELARKYDMEVGNFSSKKFADKMVARITKNPAMKARYNELNVDLNKKHGVKSLRADLDLAHRQSAGYMADISNTQKFRPVVSVGDVDSPTVFWNSVLEPRAYPVPKKKYIGA